MELRSQRRILFISTDSLDRLPDSSLVTMLFGNDPSILEEPAGYKRIVTATSFLSLHAKVIGKGMPNF
jgi:hypothetical protein